MTADDWKKALTDILSLAIAGAALGIFVFAILFGG